MVLGVGLPSERTHYDAELRLTILSQAVRVVRSKRLAFHFMKRRLIAPWLDAP